MEYKFRSLGRPELVRELHKGPKPPDMELARHRCSVDRKIRVGGKLTPVLSGTYPMEFPMNFALESMATPHWFEFAADAQAKDSEAAMEIFPKVQSWAINVGTAGP